MSAVGRGGVTLGPASLGRPPALSCSNPGPPPAVTGQNTAPQLTPEESSIPSRVALGQGHFVVRLVQDGGEDTAEGPGSILGGESKPGEISSALRSEPPPWGQSPQPCLPGTLFSKLYLLRSRDSVARRSPWVRAPYG